ncbi:hypothetical protein HYT84_02100 [Candidatus Micrarchaeota archaeon]|nr:hypothetical protein [Candidatus Micrarchaeota archaeon]
MKEVRFKQIRFGAERLVRFSFRMIRPTLEGATRATESIIATPNCITHLGIGGEKQRPRPVIRFPHGIIERGPKREALVKGSVLHTLKFNGFLSHKVL